LHHHDSIALQAAWEEVTLTVPVKPKVVVRPDRQKLDWFLGFLEGRAHVRAPPWWAEALLDSRANARDNIYPGNPKEPPYHSAGLDWSRSPRDTTLKREGGKAILRVGEQALAIPEDLLRKADSGRVWSNVSALLTPKRCYVAVHGDEGYGYWLTCIDRTSDKVLWKARVWASWWGGTTGVGHMWVTVTEQKGRVVVFGAESIGMHVEAFRAEDGQNVFRFATSYWRE
jgi:hypothetical protein